MTREELAFAKTLLKRGRQRRYFGDPAPSVMQQLLNTTKTLALTQAKVSVQRSKDNFLGTFSNFVTGADLAKLEDWWEKAASAKEAQFLAQTADEAQEQADIYDSYEDAIEEYGNALEIVGKAKLGTFARSLMHEAIAGTFAVLGGVLQAGLTILLPGAGSLLGAGLNAGIQHVVAHFNS